MGFTGELVRRVFSRNRSTASYESKGRKNSTENQRWGSVRSYLCGNEFNLVVAEEDSASLKNALSSESLLSSVFLFTHARPPMASCVLVDHRCQWLPSILPVKTTPTRSVTARLITGWFSIRLE
ncbi:uncharacterized protein DS421_19g659820 [Arachis hypogaea]|uniref:Uncharacterized protein n=1 Tax=Arachis hypogaea TaxID=3818 RepID=A0A6B9VDR5_ARAHY|nr:uncharacterized protein DS421_19g659820 [Arachis hypogaea]